MPFSRKFCVHCCGLGFHYAGLAWLEVSRHCDRRRLLDASLAMRVCGVWVGVGVGDGVGGDVETRGCKIGRVIFCSRSITGA